MPLIKKKLTLKSVKTRRLIKISEVARILGCGRESIRTGAIGNFKLIRLSEKTNGCLYVETTALEKFLDQQTGAAAEQRQ